MSQNRATRIREATTAGLSWQEAGDLDELPACVLPDINRLLGVDATGWNDLDRRTGELRLLVYPEDLSFMDDMGMLEALLDQHPLMPLMDRKPGPPVSWPEVASMREFRRTDLYGEFMRPHGIGNQMSYMVSHEPWIALVVNRERGEFSVAQRELAELTRLHLRAAYRRIDERAKAAARLAALEAGIEELSGAIAVLDDDGGVEHCSGVAAGLLRRWFSWDGGTLPFALRELRGEARLRRPDAVLVVRPVGEGPRLLVLSEQRLEPDPERARRLRLTGRETEVLALVDLGLSDAEIGRELAISHRTVAKHLEHAFEKLGLRERRRAAARLFGRDAS